MDEFEKSPEQIVGEIKEVLSKLRVKCFFFKFAKDPAIYENVMLALDSADFYLDRMVLSETNLEIQRATNIIKEYRDKRNSETDTGKDI